MLEGSLEIGTNTVVHTSGTSREHLLDLVSSRAVDGLVAHLAPHDPILDVLDQIRVPVVAVADRLSAFPSICVDDEAGGMLLAQHLAHQGHRHVLVKQATMPAPSAIHRVEAFVRTASRLGMTATVRLGDNFGKEILAAEDIEIVTREHDRATAIFGWSDRVAELVCHSLTAIGLRIPADVAVVGFDGFHSSFAHRFDLTTIRAPWAEVGRTAVTTLASLLRGETVPETTILPVDFVRGTTS
jgi:DNA-binding LacI/PurR family transcriptional regulator